MANKWDELAEKYYNFSCIDPITNMCSITNASKKTKKTTQPKVTNRVSTTASTAKKYSYNFDKGRTDKRVSLNVAPLINGSVSSDSNFVERVTYVLGQKKLSTAYVYGFLYGCLNKSCGLIFPYTPTVSVSHQVNYDTTDIFHSNLSAVHYKNSPPPSIGLNATFTADTRDNALHMLSALWFLRAVTKCDFGEHNGNNDNNYPGLPPPVLYLNGYNQIMDNIPVVVESFSYNLPEDKDYVSIGINLNCRDSNKFIYTGVNEAEPQSGNMLFNGIKTALESITSEKTTVTYNGKSDSQYYFNNWLPTELKFDIKLRVVPNLLKYKKQFDLNKYKMGIYNLPKLSGSLFVPTSNGNVNMSCIEYNDIVDMIINEGKEQISELMSDTPIQTLQTSISSNQTSISSSNQSMIPNDIIVRNKINDIMQNTEQNIKDFKKNNNQTLQPKTYKFDRSGWTW